MCPEQHTSVHCFRNVPRKNPLPDFIPETKSYLNQVEELYLSKQVPGIKTIQQADHFILEQHAEISTHMSCLQNSLEQFQASLTLQQSKVLHNNSQQTFLASFPGSSWPGNEAKTSW